MKVLVCGGRHYADWKRVEDVLDYLDAKDGITAVVNGGQDGADKLGKAWGENRKKAVFTVEAEWGRYGRRAGPIRNAQMLAEHPDIALVVAFPGNHGTADMVGKAGRRGIRILEIPERRGAWTPKSAAL